MFLYLCPLFVFGSLDQLQVEELFRCFLWAKREEFWRINFNVTCFSSILLLIVHTLPYLETKYTSKTSGTSWLISKLLFWGLFQWQQPRKTAAKTRVGREKTPYHIKNHKSISIIRIKVYDTLIPGSQKTFSIEWNKGNLHVY